MSPEKEKQIGASEHQKIIKQYGIYDEPRIASYVSGIGARVTAKTERPDIDYKFFIIDSPIVNAFALPGGYIYVSRGLLALAQNEAELAAVLGHEAGHITARHSAERYSHGVVTSLGTTLLSVALQNAGASQALGLGSQLYMSGYSRGQENEADTLGLRYAHNGNYNPQALSSFLSSLEREKTLAGIISGSDSSMPSYFSTHPPTQERVNKTAREAKAYSAANTSLGRATYLKAVDGLPYGDSTEQGFMRKGIFYHPKIGFKLQPPKNFTLINQPSQIVMKAKNSDALILFDLASGDGAKTPLDYLQNIWMKGTALSGLETVNIHGKNGATGQFEGKVNSKPMTIRVIAVEWDKGRYARFQVAIPQAIYTQDLDEIKAATYSLQSMTEREFATVKPARLKIVTAKFGDSAESLAARQPFTDGYALERFRVLNALPLNEGVKAGVQYKIVVE